MAVARRSAALKETYLSKAAAGKATPLRMSDTPRRVAPNDDQKSEECDLERRLERYRRRVEAEGRPRSVKLIDRAIEDAGKKARGDP